MVMVKVVSLTVVATVSTEVLPTSNLVPEGGPNKLLDTPARNSYAVTDFWTFTEIGENSLKVL